LAVSYFHGWCDEWVPYPRRVFVFAATAFSILLFTEAKQRSGFFLKKKPPCTLVQCQHVNRKCSRVGLHDNCLLSDRTVRRVGTKKPVESKKRRKLAAIPKFFFEQNSRARSWWKIQLSEAP
jgi:hypothetical protein